MRKFDEQERLKALHTLAVLDTPSEERFDRLTTSARKKFGVAIAAISLVDSDRVWFKSITGLGVQEVPRFSSFCTHGIVQDKPLIVSDTTRDLKFFENPNVTGPAQIMFYAGVPLVLPTGEAVGMFCLMDYHAHYLDAIDRVALDEYAQCAVSELKQGLLEDLAQ